MMITISFRPIFLRIIFLLSLASGLGLLGWIVVHTAIGDSIMTYVRRNPALSLEGRLEGIDLAVKYSPRDPLVHWSRGGVYFSAANEELKEERLPTALDELRKAAQMSPEDYRVHLALGRVLDRTGSKAEARAALERALKLAPNHFETHWALGNHLLRSGEQEASFVHMRLALATRPSALPLIFDYAWASYQGDGKAVAKALNPPVEVKPQLVALMIFRGKVEDGLSLWRELNAPTTHTPPNLKDVQRVIESLINVGRYGSAYEIWKSANIPNRPGQDDNSLLANGSFEQNFSPNLTTPFFAWRIVPSPEVRVTLDRIRPSGGNHSLRVGFNVEANTPITIATQTVPVKPKKRYCLSFLARTEQLQSLETPFVEIYDPADIKRAHAATARLPTRDNDWRNYEISLETAAATEALTVRLQRLPCAEPPCPIEGRVWFDEFRLDECTGVRKQEAGGGKQEAGNRRQEAGRRKQEAGSRRQERNP
jgi:tetratricopeptide (TPR) repeat protein